MFCEAQRLCINKHKDHPAHFVIAIDPCVIGASLHHDIARPHGHHLTIIKLHINLAGENDDIVHRLGAMHEGFVIGRIGG